MTEFNTKMPEQESPDRKGEDFHISPDRDTFSAPASGVFHEEKKPQQEPSRNQQDSSSQINSLQFVENLANAQVAGKYTETLQEQSPEYWKRWKKELNQLQKENKITASEVDRLLGNEEKQAPKEEKQELKKPEPENESDNDSFKEIQQTILRLEAQINRRRNKSEDTAGLEARLEELREMRNTLLDEAVEDGIVSPGALRAANLLNNIFENLKQTDQMKDKKARSSGRSKITSAIYQAKSHDEPGWDGVSEFYFEEEKKRILNDPAWNPEYSAQVTGYALWADDQYTTYLQRYERSNQEIMPKIDLEGSDRRRWPSYYEHLTEAERLEINSRRELINAAYYKRFRGGGNLDMLSKNESLKGISTEETKRLYLIPGVKEALKAYLDLFDKNERLFTHTVKNEEKEFSIREATTDAEVGQYRGIVQERIKDAVIEGYTRRGRIPDDSSESFDRAVSVFARDAEQIAFNLHYVGNTFESIDSVWRDGRRIVKPSAPSECVQSPIRAAMKPLDGLVYLTRESYKGSESVSKWANSSVIEEKTRLGIEKIPEYDEVVILGEDTAQEADKYWTVERTPQGGFRLYAPEARPIKLVGSLWEETKVNDKTLMDYLREGQDIPWESSDITQKIWDDYSTRLEKANKLLAFFRGEQKINFSSEGREFKWAFDSMSSLTDFGLATNSKYKRWMVYHSVGVNLASEQSVGGKLLAFLNGKKDRKPRLPSQYRTSTRTVVKASGFGGDELFFPWDRQPLMETGI